MKYKRIITWLVALAVAFGGAFALTQPMPAYAAAAPDPAAGGAPASAVAPAEPAAALLDYSLATRPYTGKAQKVVVTAKDGVTGLGAITVYYAGAGSTKYKKSTAAPKQIGKYSVTVKIAAGTDYAEKTLALGTFKIAPSVKVTWNANKGFIGSKSVSTQFVVKKKAIGKLPEPTRDGYTLKGWYTAKSGGKKVSEKTKPSEPITYFAQWTRIETAIDDPNAPPVGTPLTTAFNAKFSWPGGVNIPGDFPWAAAYGKSSMTVKYGEKYGELPNYYRVGYLLSGWYTAKSGGTKITSASTVTITKKTTFYAHWKTASADQIASDIAKRCMKEKNDAARIQAATDAVATFIAQNRYTMSGPNYNIPNGVFVVGESSCAGATRALGLVFTKMGYRWEHVNPNQWTHQWCRVWTSSGKQMWADAMYIDFTYYYAPDGSVVHELHGTTGYGER